MPRKTDDKGRIHLTIRISPELHERVKQAADDRLVSTNLLLTKLIEDGMERLIPVDEIRLTRPPTPAPEPEPPSYDPGT